MNKFTQTLQSSSKQIKAARAKIIAASAEEAQDNIVRELTREQRTLDLKLLELTDVAPDSELSLRVTKKDFNAEQLFREIQETKINKANKDIEVQIAQETYKEWFTDSKK